MKMLTTIAAAAVFSALSFGASAEMISATGSTLDSAQSQIAAHAKAAGASSYTITSARTHNGVYMTAETHNN